MALFKRFMTHYALNFLIYNNNKDQIDPYCCI